MKIEEFFHNLQDALQQTKNNFDFTNVTSNSYPAAYFKADFSYCTQVAKGICYFSTIYWFIIFKIWLYMTTYYAKGVWDPHIMYICPPILQKIISTIYLIHSHNDFSLSVLPKHIVDSMSFFYYPSITKLSNF